VLQVVTKMYFREDVPLRSTVHREVLYTNRTFLRSGDVVELPIGELAPSTGIEPVSTVTISVTEHLEAEDLNGEPSILISTGGTELIDQLADVLSFGLNAVFSRDHDLVRRLVPNSRDESNRSSASKLFRHTFDPARYVQDAELDELRRFMTQLVALRRDHFEAAMRAIRRIVRATQRAVTDPTVAYVDLVAALESLTEGTDVPAPTWDRLDDRKRRLFDQVLEGVEADVAARMRQAVMEVERLGAKSRFVAFVKGSISPEYFRTKATDAVRPIRGADFERAVKLAYDVRSRNVHVLKDLPPEAWVLGERADTVSPPGLGIMFSLEGLVRLARHVVKSYVDRAPVEVDVDFNWRASLPGQIQVQLAPQYWLWNADAFHHKSVDRYFAGFVGHLMEALAEHSKGVTDMKAVLQRIEELIPGTADGSAKNMMVGIYALWHRILAPDEHRPDATDFLAKYEDLLHQPEMPSFVVGLLSNEMPEWTDEQWRTLASERRAQRSETQHLELPSSVDAAVQVMAAMKMQDVGRIDEAQTFAGFAVEELPGNESLIAWETRLLAGETSDLDLRALVLQLEPDAEPQEATAAPG